MKHLLSIIFAIGATGGVFAQPYHRFLDNDAWVIYVGNFTESHYETISGGTPTILDGVVYYKFIVDLPFDIYFREDPQTRRVYRRIGTSEELAFDFSLSPGDAVVANGYQYTVSEVGSINVNGGTRKTLSLAGNPVNDFWIEGVGHSGHPFFSPSEAGPDPQYDVFCTYQNGTNIYNIGLAYGGTPTDCAALPVEKFRIRKSVFSPNPFHSEMTVMLREPLSNFHYEIYDVSDIEFVNPEIFPAIHLRFYAITLRQVYICAGLLVQVQL